MMNTKYAVSKHDNVYTSSRHTLMNSTFVSKTSDTLHLSTARSDNIHLQFGSKKQDTQMQSSKQNYVYRMVESKCIHTRLQRAEWRANVQLSMQRHFDKKIGYHDLSSTPFLRCYNSTRGQVLFHPAASQQLIEMFVGLTHCVPVVAQLLLASVVARDRVEQLTHTLPAVFRKIPVCRNTCLSIGSIRSDNDAKGRQQ